MPHCNESCQQRSDGKSCAATTWFGPGVSPNSSRLASMGWRLGLSGLGWRVLLRSTLDLSPVLPHGLLRWRIRLRLCNPVLFQLQRGVALLDWILRRLSPCCVFDSGLHNRVLPTRSLQELWFLFGLHRLLRWGLSAVWLRELHHAVLRRIRVQLVFSVWCMLWILVKLPSRIKCNSLAVKTLSPTDVTRWLGFLFGFANPVNAPNRNDVLGAQKKNGILFSSGVR